jgi:hypothetical protein
MFNIGLLRHLKKKYIDGDISGENGKRKIIVERILSGYRPDTISEMEPFNTFGFTSYTENKGEKLVFCIREKNKEENIHKLQLLKFVSIHEMAHIGTKQYGHPTEFWMTFKWLLKEAEASNIYKSENYMLSPTVYCGMQITYNPLFDVALKNI